MQKLDRLLESITQLMRDNHFDDDVVLSLPILAEELTAFGVENVRIWLGEIKQRATQVEPYLDVWTQGWLAAVLAHNEFSVTLNPSGSFGPDLLLKNCSGQVYIEVRRFRTDYEERKRLEEALQKTGRAITYGNARQDLKKVLDSIVAKCRQGVGLPESTSYIVMLRSDKDAIEGDLEFLGAVRELEAEARNGGCTYSELSGVLFYDPYTRWHLWENANGEEARRLPRSVSRTLQSLQALPRREKRKVAE